MEDLIPREDVVITMTKLGYIKRMSNDLLSRHQLEEVYNRSAS